MKLERLDLWLLDLVVDLRVPTASLVSEDIEGLFNRGNHGASLEELVEALARLGGHGLIGYHHRDTAERLDLASREAIRDALGRPCTTAYGLTAAGGRRWETAARPDWSRYVRSWSDLNGRYEVQAASEELADRFLAHLREHWTEVAGPVRRERLVPWRATYWKALPGGFRLRFPGREYERPRRPPKGSEFYCSVPRWYTRPW